MKVLIKEKIADSGIESLKKDFDVTIGIDWNDKELKQKIKDFDAIIIRSATNITAEIIDLAKNLKIIGRAGIGVDNVDVDAATKKGIIVANAPESNIISAGEHAIALMLSAARLIPQANSSLKSGKWERSKFEGIELYDKNLLILGLGKIGELVTHRCASFGMNIFAYDPYVSKEKAQRIGAELVEKLDDGLKKADFISVHLPKSKETLGLIGKKELAKIKKGAVIVNAARGGIIDEDALAESLKEGSIAAAGIDVFHKEPIDKSPLFDLENCVVTPHLGASTHEAQDKAGITIADQVIAALQGDYVQYALNIAVTGIDDFVKPFIPLAENLGKLFYHLVEGQLNEVEVEFAGNLADYDTKILSVAVLKGLFASVAHEPVTYVNAPLIAQDRGIELKETKTKKTATYLSSIIVRSQPDGKIIAAGGTLIGKNNQQRLTSIYDFDIDMIPSRYMAFFRYKDVPGMIGKVGTILGEKGINIANMQVGRRVLGGEALMGINVDMPISLEILERIKKEAGIGEASFLEL